MTNTELIDLLNEKHFLEKPQWVQLLSTFTEDDAGCAAALAREISTSIYGKKIFFRGIIEFTNICKNNCLYCGIRCENENVTRYRLTPEEILECCGEGYSLGYRTFVLQGGEDGYFNDSRLCAIITEIRRNYPDCAVTLSVGERSRESYRRLFDAGAERYLLRHETINEELYGKLHPSGMSLKNRLRCLRDLKEIGYKTGCGMMIGAPFQTAEELAEDMAFMCEFKPHMIGTGPFIPHCDTPFRDYPAGNRELCLFILSLCRIMLPSVLLPATTALGTIDGDGRKLGVLCGANVVMPNLSPKSVRRKYLLYDNKAGIEDDAKSGLERLKAQMTEIGYEVESSRGDYKEKLW